MLMTSVIIVTVKMKVIRHENFELDLRTASRGKLYQDGKLMFMGDAYKAITILIKNCKNPGPVQEKFQKQLTMREACRFTAKEPKKEEE